MLVAGVLGTGRGGLRSVRKTTNGRTVASDKCATGERQKVVVVVVVVEVEVEVEVVVA